MRSEHAAPLNLGSDILISIDGLVDLVCEIAGKRLTKEHDRSRPQGVRGRNSDNTLATRVLGWAPSATLEEGLTHTYRWIRQELKAKQAVRTA
jgi:nucleoside-diphosphate-sugar epimerase